MIMKTVCATVVLLIYVHQSSTTIYLQVIELYPLPDHNITVSPIAGVLSTILLRAKSQ